jgi:hypothetical protein
LRHDKINISSPTKPVISSLDHPIDLRGGGSRGMDGDLVTGDELEQYANSDTCKSFCVCADRQIHQHTFADSYSNGHSTLCDPSANEHA